MAEENIWNDYRDNFAGGWKCVSFELFDGDGPDKRLVAKPHGDKPLGRVFISRRGFLSAHMAYPDRMRQPLPSGKTWQEVKLFKDDRGLYWQTRVEVSSDPGRIGGLQERRVEYFEEGGKQLMVLQPKNDMVMEVSCMCS